MDYIKLDGDDRVWFVHECKRNIGTTTSSLVLEDKSIGEVVHRVVESYQIQWIEDKDW